MALSQIIKQPTMKLLEEKFLALSIQSCSAIQSRNKQVAPQPRLRNPTWLTKKNRVIHDDFLTADNAQFVQEVIKDRYDVPPKVELPKNTVEWTPKLKRTGVIARKIGELPLWLKTGKKISTTLLQVLDNHVIKYFTPEEYDPPRKRPTRIKNKAGCLLLGAEATDPTYLTKEYCMLFKNSGVIPKKHLARFFISPDAALPPGTPITAQHFSVGNYVDVRGLTKYRGFQGVMKRHGFKGMPASHGVTKTHRRGGNIGGGGEKGRVWPGTKMPGHMGNRYRFAKGLKIWRINTKLNVLWVSGIAVPGATNSLVYIYDTNLPRRKPSNPLAFPTYFGLGDAVAEEDIYEESLHRFSDPTIVFQKE
ncbi:hypothetical protein RI129_005085 [Pyrocoelia pectoralis]|uniref:Large ribosomal subunit protein uL3m n=1 Tax=Pyrocoelia pectoralis TaxID=417401 RepID=A0AAN7VKC6_9COLE